MDEKIFKLADQSQTAPRLMKLPLNAPLISTKRKKGENEMSNACAVCGKKIGRISSPGIPSKEAIESLRKDGADVPDEICYTCLISLREKTERSQPQPAPKKTEPVDESHDIGVKTNMKGFGLFLLLMCAIFFVLALVQNTSPGYGGFRAEEAAQATFYRVIFASLSGTCLFLGTILTAVGIAIGTLSAQNEALFSLLKKNTPPAPVGTMPAQSEGGE